MEEIENEKTIFLVEAGPGKHWIWTPIDENTLPKRLSRLSKLEEPEIVELRNILQEGLRQQMPGLELTDVLSQITAHKGFARFYQTFQKSLINDDISVRKCKEIINVMAEKTKAKYFEQKSHLAENPKDWEWIFPQIVGRYEELTEDGFKYFRLIWTMVLTQDPDFFVEPFTLRSLRFRCLITKNESSEVVRFHLSDEEIFKGLNPLPHEIYLYGAYNTMSVCQMRARGTIRLMNAAEKTDFIAELKDHLTGKNTDDQFSLKPDGKEKNDALEKLEEGGNFYEFIPKEYAHKGYERG